MSEKAKQGGVESSNPVDNEQEGPELKDERLDEASGGILIGMLLPAIQKVRETPAAHSEDVVEDPVKFQLPSVQKP